ncbi:MAG: HlyD family efflux transporter periplasmic adaptor subunit [Candidatus Saccharimonas sp.]|nr:HlyD family efflux transporter periplasmic adaptor subunit [Planctomycetaceae bacterium]
MLIDRVTLASPRAGVLAFVELREGDSVEARQVVASLDASVARANLAIARHRASSTVDRRFAKKTIELSQIEYDKAQRANSSIEGGGVFTDIDLHRLKLNVDKSILQLDQAESETKIHSLTVDQLTAELNSYAVVAPFAGRVTKVHRSKGEAVALGDPIADVINLDRVRVEGFVSIQEGLRIRPGSLVLVRLDLPDVDLAEEHVTMNGKLVFVDAGVEPVTGQIRVWAEVPNPEGVLRAGLPARMMIRGTPTLTSK